MELKDIDLNLLVVFNQLLIERNVSKVADKLGLGQPAVSNALARLRKLLGDELFIRTSSGMQPTPYADQLAESIGYALGMIHGAINVKNTFEPATSKQRFSIGMTDIGEVHFLPRLMEKIPQVAPSVSISTVRNTTINLKTRWRLARSTWPLGYCPNSKPVFFNSDYSLNSMFAYSGKATLWTRRKSCPLIFMRLTMLPLFQRAPGTGWSMTYWIKMAPSAR